MSNTSLTPASKPMPEIHVLKSLSDEEEWEYEDVSSKSDNFFLPQTPKERKYLREKFGLDTPSPLTKRFVVHKDDKKRISLAVHLWAHYKKGELAYLYEKRLTDEDFRDILAFAGMSSKWKLLKMWTIPQLKAVWRNSQKDTDQFSGHHETGFEDLSCVHKAESLYCPYNHCSTGLFDPMMTDLFTFQHSAGNESNNPTARNLFNESVDIDSQSWESRNLTTNSEKVQSNSKVRMLEQSIQRSPTKEELMKMNRGLLDEIKVLRKKVDGKSDDKSVNNVSNASEESNANKEPFVSNLLKCHYEECKSKSATFTTIQALTNHLKNQHGHTGKLGKTVCPYCGKSVKYIGQHISLMHKKGLNYCEICQRMVDGDFKVHQGLCRSCPFCDKYKNTRKDRILKHIKKKHGGQKIVSKNKMEVEKSANGGNEYKEKPNNNIGEKTSSSVQSRKSRVSASSNRKVKISKSKKKKLLKTRGREVDNLNLSVDSREYVGIKDKGDRSEIRKKLKSVSSINTEPAPLTDEEDDEDDASEEESSIIKEKGQSSEVRKKKLKTASIKTTETGSLTDDEDDEAGLSDGPKAFVSTSSSNGSENSLKNLNKKMMTSTYKIHRESSPLTDGEDEDDDAMNDLDGESSLSEATEKENENIDIKLPESNKDSSCLHKRTCYPCDIGVSDPNYESEYEEGDSCDFTDERRSIKDELESQLRCIDDVEYDQSSDEIIEKFKVYMRMKKDTKKDGLFSESKEASTVKLYPRLVEVHLFTACCQVVDAFEPWMLLDCSTVKNIKICGKERNLDPKEPVYLSSRIVDEIFKKFESNVYSCGNQIAQICSALFEFMDFQQLEFNSHTDVNGYKPLKRVMFHNSIVRTHINGLGIWKKANKSKQRTLEENNIIEGYENPHRTVEILEKNEEWKKSSERLERISKIIRYGCDNGSVPSEGEWTEMGHTIQTEIICSSGCRPKVARHMTVGAYTDKKEGFDPFQVSPNDCVVEESKGNDHILRRVDPNLPPKHKACSHQLEDKSAVCRENCEDACLPDGYNVLVHWNKNSGKKASSYIHIRRPLKVLIDFYMLIRARIFKNRKFKDVDSSLWLNDDETPVFLNSNCSPFQRVDLSPVSEFMGLDVSAYDFRKNVSTWAQNHVSEFIRRAEEESLDHSIRVARDSYNRAKQLQPQILTATYVENEDLFNKEISDCLYKGALTCEDELKSQEEKLKKGRYKSLLNERLKHKKLLLQNRPLGPRQRIYVADRDLFEETLSRAGYNVEDLLHLTPLKWRHKIVRIVCSNTGDGSSLREVWKSFYAGDYKWGVRDHRRKVLGKGLGSKDKSGILNRKDRNSFIAFSVRQSMIASKKKKD